MEGTVKKYTLRVLLLGDEGVGKTSLLRRYLDNPHSLSYIETVGAKFATKKVFIDDFCVIFNIWELTGQISFKELHKIFLQATNGVLLVYSLIDLQSLINLRHWLVELVTSSADRDIPVIIIGNKADLEPKVKQEEITKFALRLSPHIPHFYTSALTGENVEHVFESIALKILAPVLQTDSMMKEFSQKTSREKIGT